MWRPAPFGDTFKAALAFPYFLGPWEGTSCADDSWNA